MAGYYAKPNQPMFEQPLEQYGAAVPFTKTRQARPPGRLNPAAIVICLFLPWLIFSAMYATMSFSLHFQEKMMCCSFVFLGLLFVGVLAVVAWGEVKKCEFDPNANPSWAIYLAAVCFLAWVSGVAAGDINYYSHMEPFYDTSNLNSYPSVDPATMPGQQVMDAGQMSFVPGTKLDLRKTMAFHNADTYCVAPIVNGNNQSMYDFWAVGINCCSGQPGDFACGEFNNPNAAAGLRAMREDERTFYRLAVKQAESAFGIKSKHPLFFHWMQDPMLELTAYSDDGFKYFLFGVYAFFAFLLFLVIVAAVAFAR